MEYNKSTNSKDSKVGKRSFMTAFFYVIITHK